MPLPDSDQKVGVLATTYDGDIFRVTFKPNSPLKSYNANIALLGMNRQNKITAGENKGLVLKHDFVVEDFKHFPMLQNKADFVGMTQHTFDIQEGKYAVAVWVTNALTDIPIQAAGGWYE